MTKPYITRSTFQVITVTKDAPVTIKVEGDEAYIVGPQNDGTLLEIIGESQRRIAKLDIPANLVPAPLFYQGWGNRMTLPSWMNSVSLTVGISEDITFKLTDATPDGSTCHYLIESVHYVPVDLISI